MVSARAQHFAANMGPPPPSAPFLDQLLLDPVLLGEVTYTLSLEMPPENGLGNGVWQGNFSDHALLGNYETGEFWDRFPVLSHSPIVAIGANDATHAVRGDSNAWH